jgi:ABC-type transport system involved in multi-copper enzyme maturation permease subunit
MLTHFIRKEFLDSLLNQRFLAIALFSVILMPLSAVINYEYYDARKAAFDSQFAEFEPSQWSQRAYRSPALLSTLARGTEPYMPIYYAVQDDADPTQAGNIEAQDFSTLSTFGSFDFLFLVQVVFSLLAVLLAFDMVAGEKERGTLRAVLANRVPRDSVLLGKLIGGFLVLWFTFVLGFLLLFLVLVLFDTRFLEAAALMQVIFIFGISTLFLSGFYSLGLMVSTFCHSTRTAIVVLLVVWVALQLVVPKAGEMIATAVVPVRSQEALRVEKAKMIDELDAEAGDKAGDMYTKITGRSDFEGAFDWLKQDNPEVKQYREAYQQLMQGYQQQQRDRVREIDDGFARQKAQQRRVSQAIALLSPASALTFMITDASGTGDLGYQQYRDAVREHYLIVDNVLFSKRRSSRFSIRLGDGMISGDFGGQEEPNLNEIPAFTVPEPRLGNILKAHAWAFGTLLVYLVLPFLIAYVTFLKYDVR